MPIHSAHSLRFRQIHLDFHTSPTIVGIGSRFDPEEFAQTMVRAHVDSVTVFGRCHHGMAYYPSQVAPMHPGLKFDLLGQQIECLHRVGIRAPIYLTVTWDQHLGETRPDWLQRKPDGSTYGSMPQTAGWHWISSCDAYMDYLEAQVDEIFERYGNEVDGFFFDIVMTGSEGDCHPEAVQKRIARGLPDTVEGRKANDHQTHRLMMRRLNERIAERNPSATVFYNSRFGIHFGPERDCYSHVEIEALPTGGWGYGFFPQWSRFGRGFELPFLGMTGRFHTHWGDFGALKEPYALMYECGSILANGGSCSIGDQLNPNGRLEPAVYDCIGEAYRHVAAMEPWCVGAKPIAEIGLLLHTNSDDAQAGAARMLLESHWQFDAIDGEADFAPYRALVVPDGFPSLPGLAEKLSRYVLDGGAVLLGSGTPSLAEEDAALVLGVSEIAPTFFRSPSALSAGLREFDYVVYGHADDLSPLPGGEVLAERADALFNRTPEQFISHMHAPASEAAAGPAAVRKGQVIRLSQPLFTAYQQYGTAAYRRIVENALRLLAGPRLLETNAPGTAEVTLTRQGSRLNVHIVNYTPMRRGSHMEVLQDAIPSRDVQVTVKVGEGSFRAYLASTGEPIEIQISDGLAKFTVPFVQAHEIVSLEPE